MPLFSSALDIYFGLSVLPLIWLNVFVCVFSILDIHFASDSYIVSGLLQC